MLSKIIRTGSMYACLLILFTGVAASGQEPAPETSPWCDPALIDPYTDDVGDFLNVDLMAMTSAAQIASEAGDYQAAAKYYLAIIRCDVHDVIAMYDLACCYARLDQPEHCATFLRSSVARGFENLDRIQQEPAFDTVRNTPAFQEVMEEIAAEIEGRRATKRFYYATARYDDNDPESIYEMACCYALRDDARMAAEYLLHAYHAGYIDMDRIHGNPEFDTVRDSREFQAAIKTIADLQVPDEAEEEEVLVPGVPPETVYCDAEVALPCLVQFPRDYNPAEEYPLVIGLHGYGGNVERFASLWFAMEDPQFIYAVPEAPYLVPQQQYLGYSWWVWDYENKPLWDRTVGYAREFTRTLTDQLRSEYKVGDVYLLGFSQGTALTYSVGISDFPKYTGLIAVGGWLDEKWFADGAVDAANEMRVMVAHAEDDQSMQFSAGESARDYLSDAGYNVEFVPYLGGHTLTEELLLRIETWVESE